MGADRVQRGEVDGAAEAGSEGRGRGAAPEGGEYAGYAEARGGCGGADLAQREAEGVVAGLLDAGFEQIDGLEEDSRERAGAEAG